MTEIAHRNPQQELVEWVRSDERRNQIAAALPEGVSISRFERATATALLADPALVKADRASLYLAILSAAQRGLVPDGRQGAIVVYGAKAQFLPMIGGVRDTLAEYGWMLKTGVVYENDEFSMDEAAGTVRHPVRAGIDRGEIVAFYAVAIHRDGRQRMATLMSVDQVNEVRDKTGVANNPAWKKWYPQMGEKTVGHRLANDVPLAPQDRRRVEWILNAVEIGPEESAAALYGPAARETFGELPAGAATGTEFDAPSDRSSTDGHVGGVESAEPETSVPPASQAPADTTDGEEAGDEFGGDEDPVATAADGPSETDVEAAQAASAVAVKVPAKDSWANGLTIAEINARGGEGQVFFRWALGPKNKNAELRAAVAAYAKVQLPFLYAELAGEES